MSGRRLSGRAGELSAGETSSPIRTPRRPSLGNGAASLPPLTPSQEGSERVKVYVRVRPPSENEASSGLSIVDRNKTIILPRKNEQAVQTDFQFDQVLGQDADQQHVFKAAVEPIVQDVLQGYNGTIMAYGQTGAGKTYTLSSVSSAENIGQMPRAASHIFSGINADPSHIYNVVMSYAQIYREQILDLLKPENGNLTIREGPNGVFIAGIEEQPVRSVKDCLALMQHGDQNRKTALTQMNAQSSRSHAIVMLTVVKRPRRAENTSAIGEDEEIKVGKLFIVDLAGSERLKKSLSTGIRAEEAKAINLSLTTLGLCINSRADRNSKHTPFRDSKLTRLLQESLGGNAKTSLVVAIADAAEHLDETLQSIQFGQRAMRVQTKARVNQSTGKDLLNADLLKRLGSMDIATCVVDANLLAKEEELRKIQEALADERERASKAIADLEAAKLLEQQTNERERNEAQARLGLQQMEAQKHEAEVAELKALISEKERVYKKQTQALQSKIHAAESDLHISEARLSEEIHTLENQMEKLNTELEKSRKETVSAEKQGKLAQTKASQMEAKSVDLGNQLSETREQLQNSERDAFQTAQKYEDKLAILDKKMSEISAKRREELKEAEIRRQQVGGLQQGLDDVVKVLEQERKQSAEKIKELEMALRRAENVSDQKLTDINLQADQTIKKLEDELNAAKKEVQESERQASIAHEQAAHAHQQAANTTQESIEQVRQLTKNYDEHVRKLESKYENQLSTLQEKLDTALASSVSAEQNLVRDLDDLHAASSQRQKELKKQLQAQEEEFRVKIAEQEQTWSRSLETKQAEYESNITSLKKEYELDSTQQSEKQIHEIERILQAKEEEIQSQRENYEKELEEQSKRLNEDSKGIQVLKEALQFAESREDNLISEKASLQTQVKDIQEKSERRANVAKVKLDILESNNIRLQKQVDWAIHKQIETNAALVIQKQYRKYLYTRLRADRNKNAQDLAMVRKHKYDLEGQYKGLEATTYQQQIMQGRSLLENSRQLLDDALLSLKFQFLADSKSRLSFAHMQGRTASMSPLGNLSARGLHYSPSPLGRSASFMSAASDKSSNYEGSNPEGPLGSGAMIPAYKGVNLTPRHTPSRPTGMPITHANGSTKKYSMGARNL